jgi:hypothetical protein
VALLIAKTSGAAMMGQSLSRSAVSLRSNESTNGAELIALRKEENASWLQRFLVFVPGLSW